MSWGAVITGGAALVGGALSSRGAKRAGQAEARASEAAIDEERRQFDLMREDTAPYRQIGSEAIGALGRIYGYGIKPTQQMPTGPTGPVPYGGPTASGVDPSSGYRIGAGGGISQGLTNGVQPGAGGATAAGPPMPAGPDYSNFFASPDYQFRREQGTKGIERTASARGLTGSGNALAALTDYNSNLAAGEFGNYFNRQATLAGVGQSAVNSSTAAGANSAANVGNALMAGGSARASGIAGEADAWGNALGTIGGIAYDRWGRPKKGK